MEVKVWAQVFTLCSVNIWEAHTVWQDICYKEHCKPPGGSGRAPILNLPGSSGHWNCQGQDPLEEALGAWASTPPTWQLHRSSTPARDQVLICVCSSQLFTKHPTFLQISPPPRPSNDEPQWVICLPITAERFSWAWSVFAPPSIGSG